MQRQMIDNPETLEAVRKMLGARDDWHEPDEQDLTIRAGGDWDNFDNAFCDTSEAHVVIVDPTGREFGINVANLLAWACKGM